MAPVHFTVKYSAKPVTKKCWPVLAYLLLKLKENMDSFIKEGVLEGPLVLEHSTGWMHNVVITGKKWDPSKLELPLIYVTSKRCWSRGNNLFHGLSSLDIVLEIVIGSIK